MRGIGTLAGNKIIRIFVRMSESFIKATGVRCLYKDENGRDAVALDNISLEIRRGEYIAIIGRNGSGKSTLAKLFNMILDPESGTITVDGVDITSPELDEQTMLEVRRKIGMVFQNPDNQLVATIVEEDVAFGPENIGVPQAELRRRVDEALATVGMTEYAHHEPHRLSGGQKQRVAIAGVLAMKPDCIILDESTAMLDPRGRAEVIDTVERLNREEGITVIMITHYMNEAVRAGRVIMLDNGHLIKDAPPREIFSDPALLRRYGLDVPQSVALVERLRGAGLKLDGCPISPEECAQAIHAALRERAGKGVSHT